MTEREKRTRETSLFDIAGGSGDTSNADAMRALFGDPDGLNRPTYEAAPAPAEAAPETREPYPAPQAAPPKYQDDVYRQAPPSYGQAPAQQAQQAQQGYRDNGYPEAPRQAPPQKQDYQTPPAQQYPEPEVPPDGYAVRNDGGRTVMAPRILNEAVNGGMQQAPQQGYRDNGYPEAPRQAPPVQQAQPQPQYQAQPQQPVYASPFGGQASQPAYPDGGYPEARQQAQPRQTPQQAQYPDGGYPQGQSYGQAPAQQAQPQPQYQAQPQQPVYASPFGAQASQPAYPDGGYPEARQQAPRQQAYGQDPMRRVIYEDDPTRTAEARSAQIQRREDDFQYNYASIDKPKAGYKTFRQKTISVFSPKGGVGKSSVSKELACTYASPTATINGQRLKVLIVDVDWEYPDMHLAFNVDPHPSIANWVNAMVNDYRKLGKIPMYDKRMIESCIIPIGEGLDLLAGSPDPTTHVKITEEMVEAICTNIAALDYDVVIYDNANSSNEKTFRVLEHSDSVVLVATLDFSTVDEIMRFLTTARNRSFDLKKINLVINNVPDKIKGSNISPDQIVNMYNVNFITEIPSDDDVRLHNNSAEPIMWSGKETKYTKAMSYIANSLLPVFEEEQGGFFSRLFGKKKKKKRK